MTSRRTDIARPRGLSQAKAAWFAAVARGVWGLSQAKAAWFAAVARGLSPLGGVSQSAPSRAPRRFGVAIAATLLALATLTPGCVKRTIEIRTEPPGAMVYYNGENKGVTPCEFEFHFYGTSEITLAHPGHVVEGEPVGYEIHKKLYEIDAPWYQWPLLDAVSELVIPFTIHDRHDLGTVALEKRKDVPLDELLERGRALQEELQPNLPQEATP